MCNSKWFYQYIGRNEMGQHMKKTTKINRVWSCKRCFSLCFFCTWKKNSNIIKAVKLMSCSYICNAKSNTYINIHTHTLCSSKLCYNNLYVRLPKQHCSARALNHCCCWSIVFFTLVIRSHMLLLLFTNTHSVFSSNANAHKSFFF